MAQIIWTNPALASLDTIADYIALENPEAARSLVRRIFLAVDQLSEFPRSGSRLPEWPKSVYRHLVVPPCRVFYRPRGAEVWIVFVMRSERQLRRKFLQ